jgi:hypothetical protein
MPLEQVDKDGDRIGLPHGTKLSPNQKSSYHGRQYRSGR